MARVAITIDGVEKYATEVTATPTPDAPPLPQVSGGLFNPTTGVELQTALQLALDQGYVLMCDSRARPVISAPIMCKVNDRGTRRHGLQGNGMQLLGSLSSADQTLMTLELGSLQNRHLFMENIAFDDRNYQGKSKANGLLLKGRRATGENGLYSFILSKLLFEGAKDGLTIDGYVFEGIIDIPEGTNCDRIVVCRMDAGNILSNVIIRTPLMRASRIGIDCEYANSVMITGSGSMIDITERGIKATNGVKLIDGIDFENVGQGHAIEIAATDYPMRILNCTGSNTMNKMPHLIKYTGAVDRLMHANNRMNYAGQGVFTPDSTVQA
jgi:hypothetical protein